MDGRVIDDFFFRDNHYLVKIYSLRGTGLIMKPTHGSFWIPKNLLTGHLTVASKLD